jgi:hypothetical protein
MKPGSPAPSSTVNILVSNIIPLGQYDITVTSNKQPVHYRPQRAISFYLLIFISKSATLDLLDYWERKFMDWQSLDTVSDEYRWIGRRWE